MQQLRLPACIEELKLIMVSCCYDLSCYFQNYDYCTENIRQLKPEYHLVIHYEPELQVSPCTL